MTTEINILMIDDEPDILEIMSKRLEKRGYHVLTSQSCSGALDILRKSSVDVIILDVMLPHKNGIQCLGEIKRDYPHVAVILLTGHASMQTGIDSLKLGAVDYCLKPISIEDLAEKIEIAYRDKQ